MVFDVGSWMGEVSGFHANPTPQTNRTRGCIAITQDLMLRILTELCNEIYRNGFNKILLVNAHGGNRPILNHFLRCQSYEKKPYALMWTEANNSCETKADAILKVYKERPEFLSMLTEEDIKTLEKWVEIDPDYGGGHADFRETALALAYDKSLVAEDKYDAESGLSTHIGDYLEDEEVWIRGAWGKNFPNSYEGIAPHGASVTIGEAMYKIHVERMIRIIKKLKTEDTCLKLSANALNLK
jgi:creatinine amidohydrolase